jgi:hypothetical protein
LLEGAPSLLEEVVKAFVVAVHGLAGALHGTLDVLHREQSRAAPIRGLRLFFWHDSRAFQMPSPRVAAVGEGRRGGLVGVRVVEVDRRRTVRRPERLQPRPRQGGVRLVTVAHDRHVAGGELAQDLGHLVARVEVVGGGLQVGPEQAGQVAAASGRKSTGERLPGGTALDHRVRDVSFDD